MVFIVVDASNMMMLLLVAALFGLSYSESETGIAWLFSEVTWGSTHFVTNQACRLCLGEEA